MSRTRVQRSRRSPSGTDDQARRPACSSSRMAGEGAARGSSSTMPQVDNLSGVVQGATWSSRGTDSGNTQTAQPARQRRHYGKNGLVLTAWPTCLFYLRMVVPTWARPPPAPSRRCCSPRPTPSALPTSSLLGLTPVRLASRPVAAAAPAVFHLRILFAFFWLRMSTRVVPAAGREPSGRGQRIALSRVYSGGASTSRKLSGPMRKPGHHRVAAGLDPVAEDRAELAVAPVSTVPCGVRTVTAPGRKRRLANFVLAPRPMRVGPEDRIADSGARLAWRRRERWRLTCAG